MKIIYLILGVFVIAVIIFAAISLRKSPANNTSTPIPTVTQIPQSSNPEDKNIILDSPKADEEVTIPFSIKGKARVFENQFNYRVLDSNRNVLTEGSAYANAADTGQFGNFTIEINSIAANSGSKLTIEIFDYSAKDGSAIDKVSIPVTLR